MDETLITYPVPDDMLDLLKKVLLPRGINPKRRNSEAYDYHCATGCSKRGVGGVALLGG